MRSCQPCFGRDGEKDPEYKKAGTYLNARKYVPKDLGLITFHPPQVPLRPKGKAFAALLRHHRRWIYEMEDGSRETRGTTITLYLGEDGKEFLDESTLYVGSSAAAFSASAFCSSSFSIASAFVMPSASSAETCSVFSAFFSADFSGATDFLTKFQEKTEQENEIIGHFGLGFYSAFMVAFAALLRHHRRWIPVRG